jgi:DNA-directed RNA polymerase specialized sigma24 family protein
MSSVGSVTSWIRQLKAGERNTIQNLWEEYFSRLVQLARKKLQGVPRQKADEEDVALSAFDSFCRCAAEGRFAQLSDRNDLWQLLVLLTIRKACNLRKHALSPKQGGGKVRHASALPGPGSSVDGPLFAEQIGLEPTPAFAAELVDNYRRLLDRLGNDQLRAIAVWKMEGWTNAEIAAKLDRAPSRVESKLRLIRGIWEKEGAS